MTISEEAEILANDCEDLEDALQYVDDSVEDLILDHPHLSEEEIRETLIKCLRELYDEENS